MQPFDAQAPTSIEFRGNESRWEALFYAGFGVAIIWWAASKGGWTGIVGGIGFGVFFALLTFGKAMAEPDRSVRLAFDADGLLAPNVFARKLPWAAIEGFAFCPGSEIDDFLFVKVREPKLYEPIPKKPLEFWPVTQTGFRLAIAPLGCAPDDIEAAFRRFAPGIPKI
ncbi:hypothetical protein [Bosea lathyri]|uniref:PH domain-containing protein n=1 Tax=Bosea lathyri TaxID=1036778 RepID=A0A1H6D395_9HYPH|nr:hypothetical protein [Bosea lathyri]SEG79792.1 hypothetical protein SAMN04488115_11520 [Bosea lathyri]